MEKAFAALSLLVAACTYYQDPLQADAEVIRPGNFIKGSGVITSVSVLPYANKGNARDPNLYRLWLQMDIGGFQTVDTDNGTFFPGQAVELTNDGRILHVTGMTFNR